MTGELEMQINTHNPTLENRSFEIGESSGLQGFNLPFSNNLGMTDSAAGFYMGEDFEVVSSAY